MLEARIARRTALIAATASALLVVPTSWALNPSFDISQYGHRAWRNLDGFGLGTIVAIAQTTDGYIWLATPTELQRFDGVRRVSARLATGKIFDEGARALRGSHDGSLWIGSSRGLFVLRNGSIQADAFLSGVTVNAIEEDNDGTIWAAGAARGEGALCAIRRRGVTECHGQDGRLGTEIVGLHLDNAGSLWVVGVDRVWKWGSDPMVSFALPARADVVRSVAELADGTIVIGLRGQVTRIAAGRIETLSLPSWTRDLAFDKVLRDRDGSLWLGTADSGLLHLHDGRLDTYAASDGLSGDKVLDLYEDREGSVWVSTSRGVDQFRPTAAAKQSGLNGLQGRSRAVLRAGDGSMWASTTTGIYQSDSSNTWKLHRSWSLGVGSLFEDRQGRIWTPSQNGIQYFDGHQFVDAGGIPAGPIDAMAEDRNGDLWLAHRDLGLLRVHSDNKSKFAAEVVAQPSSRVSTLTIDPVDGTLWVGLWSGTLEHVRDGQLVRGPALFDGPAANSRVTHVRAEPDGTLWVSTFAGLFRIARGRATRMTVDRGAACDRILSSLPDKTALWLNAQCGLIRVERAEADAWMNAADRGILRKVASQLLDISDGVDQSIAGRSIGSINPIYNYAPKLAESPDGRPWVVTGDSLVTIDPRRVPSSDVQPPVYVEQLVGDGKSYDARSGLRLPPLQHNLEISYTGLNFASPERIQFRYRLEGRDTEWQNAGSRRQAFYTDLPPGTYRFRVDASNQGDVWSGEGASIAFAIPPAWYQSSWFRALDAVSACAVLFAIYRARLAQVTGQVRSRLEAQLAERERIARELHDTLLQGIQGLILRFQAAADRMPMSEPVRLFMEQSLDRADELLVEGRDRVRELRPSAASTVTLPEALAAQAAQLGSLRPARFQVTVQGGAKELHPIVHGEGFLIAREALTNAFRHARARDIEVEISYGKSAFQLLIRDNGCGIADELLSAGGRPGHYGLLGMCERAQKLGARVDVWSKAGLGTEVALRVPAKVAYVAGRSPGERLRRWIKGPLN